MRERRIRSADSDKAGVLDVVEEALASAQQHGDDVKDELVDRLGRERLPHG